MGLKSCFDSKIDGASQHTLVALEFEFGCVGVFDHLVMQANVTVALHTRREQWPAPNNECCGSERELIVQGIGRRFRVLEHACRGRVFVRSSECFSSSAWMRLS